MTKNGAPWWRCPGPWDDEPDQVAFSASDYPCTVKRNVRIGHLCGYVIVPAGHPLHGITDYMDDRLDPLEVHGGITYLEPASEGCWELGFDCAHSGDLIPKDALRPKRDWEFYKNYSYVRAETEALARQLKAMAEEL